MYESKTYKSLLDTALASAPAGVDTRQGSIFFDAVAAICQILSGFYADLDNINDIISLDTAVDDYLTLRANERGIYRQSATNSLYEVTFTGTAPDVGTRFFYNGLYFVYLKTTDNVDLLECETAGTVGNVIASGSIATPVNAVPRLTATTFGAISEPGTDDETDDSLRRRLKEAMATPGENGNKQHYKSWCESIDGVGRARIIPLWDGANTVKAIIISDEGVAASSAVVANVQDYIDPNENGDGSGVANIGAVFTAVAPTETAINISYTVTLTTGYSVAQAQTQTETAITAYLKALALDTADGTFPVVRIAAIGALINGLDAVLDYADLTVNSGTANIETTVDTVAILGTVTVA